MNNIELTPGDAARYMTDFLRLGGFGLILGHGAYEVKPSGSLPYRFGDIQALCDRIKPICQKLTLALELLELRAAAAEYQGEKQLNLQDK